MARSWEDRLRMAVAFMEEDAREIKTPLSYPNPPAPRESIDEAEKSLGFKLCDEHKEFLLKSNGWKGALDGWNFQSTADLIRRSQNHQLDYEAPGGWLTHQGVNRNDLCIGAWVEGDPSILLFVSHNSKTLPGRFIWFHFEEVARYMTFGEVFDGFLDLRTRRAEGGCSQV